MRPWLAACAVSLAAFGAVPLAQADTVANTEIQCPSASDVLIPLDAKPLTPQQFAENLAEAMSRALGITVQPKTDRIKQLNPGKTIFVPGDCVQTV